MERQWAKHAGQHFPQSQVRETYFSSNVHQVRSGGWARTGSSYRDNESFLSTVRDQLGFSFANQVDVPGLSLSDGDVQANGAKQGNGSLVEAHVSAVPVGDKLEKENFEPCFV